MMRNGGAFLLGALVCFLAFFGNVALGAAGQDAPLGDVAEMLMLFAASLLFVAGVLQRESARERAEAQSALMNE